MKLTERKILHVDMNNCYASIESLYHPELAGLPIAVAGSVEERHGIILAKNMLAKAAGVQTGEAIWQAKEKCPGLVTLEPHYELYLAYSKRAHKIYERYTDRIQQFGLDECWLDVSAIRSPIGKIADEIRETIKRELRITVSIGASFNKVFAKLGSDMKKPDATTVITRRDFREKVWGLPVRELLYVGSATDRKLRGRGIFTIGDLARAPLDMLRCMLGKWGICLHAYANGLDNEPIPLITEAPVQVKSVGNGTTAPHDLENDREVNMLICTLSESVASRLRKAGLKAFGVSVAIRNARLETYSTQRKLTVQTDDAPMLSKTAFALYQRTYDWSRGIPIRSITVTAYELIRADEPVQTDLFMTGERLDKRERLNSAIDRIRARFGYTAINRAVIFGREGYGSFDTALQNEIHPGYLR